MKCYDVVTKKNMITIYNNAPVFVGTTNVELSFTNNGVWILPEATYIAAGTNSDTSLSGYRSGAVVTVDSGGTVKVVDGPDVTGYVIRGFSYSILTLGVAIVIVWAVTRLMNAGATGVGE